MASFAIVRLLAAAALWEPAAAPVQPTADDPVQRSQPAESNVGRDGPAEPVGRARLRGRVLIYGDRDPARGARLIPKNGTAPIRTDAEGEFSAELKPGDHAFIVRAPGFVDLEVQVALTLEQDLEMEYFLEPHLDGARYRTVVEQQREVAVSSTTLKGAEIREVAGSRGDPLRVVNSLPGVTQLAGFLPYIVVRGSAPGNTGYYLDGTRIPILFHVAIGPSVIHPYFIDAVDFYPGGTPVRLGRFTSGMIEARTRPARRDRVHGEFDMRLTDAGGLVEVPISRPVDKACRREHRRKDCEKGAPRGSLTLAGRYSYTAGVLTLVQSDTTIAFWDYQARFDHDIGSSARYTAFAYGSFDDLGSKGPEGDSTLLRFAFHRLDNRVRQRLPRGGTASYAVVLGIDQTGIEEVEVGTNEYRIAPRIDFRVPTKRAGVSLGFGLDQEFQIFRLTSAAAADPTSAAALGLLFSDRFVSVTGAYFDAIFKKGNAEIRPGFRADLYAQVGASPYVPDARVVTHTFGIDPRLLARERVAQRWVLKQSLGVYHQPPTFPIPLPGIESFGFERGLQRNVQGSFGYEFEVVPDLVKLEQEGYVGRLSNLQDYELGETDSNPVNELEDIISQVTGWSYGLETMLKLDPKLRTFGWAAYTLSRSTRDFKVGGRAPSTWDQRHIMNFVLGYRISHKWNVGTRVHYQTGRPWTARDDGETQREALENRRNNARLPPFFQLDARVERIWRWPNWQLSASLDISNATYSREIFACAGGDESDTGTPLGFRARTLAAAVDPKRGIVKCTPQGFRYTIPSLGLRARW